MVTSRWPRSSAARFRSDERKVRPSLLLLSFAFLYRYEAPSLRPFGPKELRYFLMLSAGNPGIRGWNLDDFRYPFTPYFMLRLGRNIRHLKQCLISYPNTSENFIKILRCVSYFQYFFRCLDIPIKHGLSCLIYYENNLKVQIVFCTQ